LRTAGSTNSGPLTARRSPKTRLPDLVGQGALHRALCSFFFINSINKGAIPMQVNLTWQVIAGPKARQIIPIVMLLFTDVVSN
jgi:hypothetical protein